jgi:dUTP pyrophosphatase
MPEVENPLDAAFDLRAHIITVEDDSVGERILIPSGDRVLVTTGLKFALPPNIELQIRPRSGLALHPGIDVANSPGTVDPGYRGEVKVILENRGDEPFEVRSGDRIAQAAIRPVFHPSFEEVDEVPEDTERGEGGFGSTGV